MITRENGNIVLADSTGRHAYSVFDAQYGVLAGILDRQNGAAKTNLITAQNYNQLIDNLQISVDAGHPQTQPPKPLMIVVADDGTETHVPFATPLKDLRAAPVVKVDPSAGSGASQIPAGAGGLTSAEQRAQYNMTTAIYHKLFPDA